MNQTAYARHMKQGLQYALDGMASTGNVRRECLALAVSSLEGARRASQADNAEEYALYAQISKIVSAMRDNQIAGV